MRVVLKFKVQVLGSPKIHKLTIDSSMVNNFSRTNCVETKQMITERISCKAAVSGLRAEEHGGGGVSG